MQVGYALSSEEHSPLDLVRNAVRAEEAGSHTASREAKGPTDGMQAACWATSEDYARATALEWWPNAGLKGTLVQELPLPSHFEQAAEAVDEETIAEVIVCGPKPEAHLAGIRRFADAGFDHVYVHQVGPDQHGFIDFYARRSLGEPAEASSPQPPRRSLSELLRLGSAEHRLGLDLRSSRDEPC